MGKSLAPVTGNPTGVDLKQTRGNELVGRKIEVNRPPLPVDMQSMPNVRFVQGQQNPTQVNMMFAFGKQPLRGAVAYGPCGEKRAGRYVQLGQRDVIKCLGGNRGNPGDY